MFWWEMCGEDRDLVVSGNGVYGGGGPRMAAIAAVVEVVVTAELRGRTTGGAADGVAKRKGPLGNEAAVVEDARLRDWVVLWPDDDGRLRTVGVMLLLRG